MSKKVEIKEASPEDFPLIAAIYNEYIMAGNATMEESLKTEKNITAWVDKFHERERLYVLKEDEITVGWGIIKRYSDREGYRFACETAVYLTDKKRGLGYGTMIKQHLIEACKKMNYKHLVAKIFATNTASIEYNLKMGYSIVGIQKQIGFKKGKWMDIAILQYVIED